MTKEFTKEDQRLMIAALKEAKKAFDKNEIPIGAVLTIGGKIIARGHNQTEKTQDATKHAEIICLQKGCRYLKSWRLYETILYTTTEPCIMCLGAALLARIKKIICGCPNMRHGLKSICFLPLARQKKSRECSSSLHSSNHQLKIVTGLMHAEAQSMLQNFFSMLRSFPTYKSSTSSCLKEETTSKNSQE